jgi:hypothetical protein
MKKSTKLGLKMAAAGAAAGLLLTLGALPANANTLAGTRTCGSQIRVTSNSTHVSGVFILEHNVTGVNGYRTEILTPGTRTSVNGSYSGTWSATTLGANIVNSASSSCSGIA